jgi:hypothetical protein
VVGGMSMHLQYKFKKEVQFKIHENVLKELDTIEKDIREVAASKGISVSDTIDYLRNKKKNVLYRGTAEIRVKIGHRLTFISNVISSKLSFSLFM